MPIKDSSRGGVVLSLTCEHCGVAFTRYACHQRSPHTFCGPACRSQGMRLRSTQRRRAYDKSEAAERQRASHRRVYERRRAWYSAFMQGKRCLRCGADGPNLQWHHVDPASKSFPVARGVNCRSQDIVLEEIAKCALLCRNCHREAHRELRAVVAI